MARKKAARVDEFRGLVKDIHPRRLPLSAFSVDEGSERESGVAWKPRRGMIRTNLPIVTGPGKIRELIAWDTLRGTRAVLSHTDTQKLDGFTDVDDGDGSGATMHALFSVAANNEVMGMAVAKGRAYAADGRRSTKRWDGITTTIETAGIAMAITDWTPTPTTAAGNCTVGTHLFRYRYLDSKTGFVSNPSNEVEIAIASGAERQTFAVAAATNTNIIRSADSKVDKIVLEMTLKDGSVSWYTAATILNAGVSTAVANSSDETLGDSPILYPAGRLSNGVPPFKRWLLSHKGYLWAYGEEVYTDNTCAVTNASATVTGTSTDWEDSMAGKAILIGGDNKLYTIAARVSAAEITLTEAYTGSTDSGLSYKIFSQDNTVYVSQAGWPESWHPYDFVQGPLGGGPISAAAGTPYGLVLFSETKMESYTFGGNPITSGRKDVISDERGALNPRVVVVVGGIVYSMDRRGWHRYAGPGTDPEPISSPIDDVLTELVFGRQDQFHGVYYPRLNAIRWFVILTGDTEPKDYVQYDIASGAWSRGDRERGITAAFLANTDDGQRVLIGDENGYTWLDDQGTVDGLAASDVGQAHVVATAATSTKITKATAAFPTAGTGLDGMLAYWVEGDESQVITSNTATTFDTSAWASTPNVGDTFHIGRILSKIKTKAFHVRRDNRIEPVEAVITVEPLSSTRYLWVRMYLDGSATAFSDWSEMLLDREAEDGYFFPASGKNYFRVDLTATAGVIRVPLGIEDAWTVELELESTEPDARFALLSVDFVGLDAEKL